MRPDLSNLKEPQDIYDKGEVMLTKLKAKYNTLDENIKIAIWAGAIALLAVLVLIGINSTDDFAGLNK